MIAKRGNRFHALLTFRRKCGQADPAVVLRRRIPAAFGEPRLGDGERVRA
jgi:hypothetical protein